MSVPSLSQLKISTPYHPISAYFGGSTKGEEAPKPVPQAGPGPSAWHLHHRPPPGQLALGGDRLPKGGLPTSWLRKGGIPLGWDWMVEVHPALAFPTLVV